ncbi:MAG: NAD(P)/FAD-dependent oxidoreductase [Erysipelotrichia bacterium]|nr:NAD(P)/FAD-dependent oxidoreductase [Erysipelotrichia bacterium]
MYDVIIIGAGVIGSATAYYLAQYNISTLVLESSNDVSNGTSKANTAIIHAGYDPKPHTLMAKYNVEGSLLTKELCRKLDVPYINNGAMVLAFNDEEIDLLKELYQRGIENGVEGLTLLDSQQAKEAEAEISTEVKGALLVKTSAIISPWEYTYALIETAVRNGVTLKLNNKVTDIKKEKGIFTVKTTEREYQCKYIINAAGIFADKVHEMIGEKEFTINQVRGQYYLLDKSQGAKTKHTLFQCPNRLGKGVVVSPTVHGNLIVGPNAETINDDDTSTTADGLKFVKEKAIKSIPTINFGENIRNFAGIRAKSDRDDFIVEESKSVENFFNLAAMASPALSSAPAIALEAVKWILNKTSCSKKTNYIDERKKIRFKDLSPEEKNNLIKSDPSYGRIICRCETITEGEILQCLNTPIPPCSIDGIKRRTNAGMGRCQGGFCSEKIALILMNKLNLNYRQILQDEDGSNILLAEAKEGYENV